MIVKSRFPIKKMTFKLLRFNYQIVPNEKDIVF